MTPIEAGARYGRLTVIAFAGSKKVGKSRESKRIVKVRCDCGVVCLKIFTLVKNGHVKSCGCLQKEWVSQHALNRRKPFGESALNAFFSLYKNGARRRKLEFSISFGEFRQLTRGNCDYCGVPPTDVYAPNELRGGYVHNGIDRVDNTKGYTSENCVPCCRKCNMAKGTMSKMDFERWLDRIVSFRQQIKAA